MSARKPKIQYYWTPKKVAIGLRLGPRPPAPDFEVNWRLVGANGEVMCQSTQGFRDKADAQRSVQAVTLVFVKPEYRMDGTAVYGVREVGPGRKP